MSDPFAHGMPVGDSHSWAKPPSEPCPNCDCCSEELCQLAVAKKSACHWEGSGSAFDLSACPCWKDRRCAMSDRRAWICQEIVRDMKRDVASFDGRPLDGRTAAEIHATLAAAISALAGVVETLLPKDDAPPLPAGVEGHAYADWNTTGPDLPADIGPHADGLVDAGVEPSIVDDLMGGAAR